MTFEEARAQFPVLARVAYLNAGTFGPLPRAATEAMLDEARRDLEDGRGGRPYIDAMLELRTRLRARVAKLLNADQERISLTSSTTDGCNIVVAGLALQPGDEIVTTDAEHFGLAGPLFTSGARVRVAQVQGRPAAEALDVLVASVTRKTRLIAISHVLWTTGHVIDAHELKARTGLPLLVDGAQAVGAIPVEMGALDFYTVSGQKWLCGPESTGALYVRDPEALRVARPTYFAQESFVAGGEYVARPGAQRFDSGWISVSALRGWEAALELAPEWRFDRIREIAARCRDALVAAGVEVVTEPDHAGLVTFVPRGDAAETVARAFAQGVVIRDLPGTGWARASCGWWTSEEDVERLRGAL